MGTLPQYLQNNPPTPNTHITPAQVDSITYSDFYLLANDFPDYIRTQVQPHARPQAQLPLRPCCF